jgi:hypothetical protein
MSDITLNLEGVAPEVATILQSDAAKAVIAAAIEAAKAPLVTNRDKVLADLAAKNARLKQYDELGGLETLTAAQQARAEAAEAARLAAETSTNAETVKKHYSEQLSAKDQELIALRTSVLEEKVGGKLSAAIREAKGVPELLEPHLRNRVKAELVGGKVQITVLTAAGAPMLKDNGADATMADLIAEFKANAIYGRAFEAPQASGAGGKADAGTQRVNPFAKATQNVTEQSRLYRQDKALAIRLAAEAGVTIR